MVYIILKNLKDKYEFMEIIHRNGLLETVEALEI